MARFGFCGPTYTSESVNVAADRTVNWYPESVESGTGASAVAMYPTPGLAPFAQLGGSKVRGMYAYNGRLFVVSDTLYEVRADGTWNYLANDFPADDGQPVTMEANSAGQLLVCASGKLVIVELIPFSEVGANAVQYYPTILPHSRQEVALLSFTTTTPASFQLGQTVYFSAFVHTTGLNGLNAQVTAVNTADLGLAVTAPTGFSSPYFEMTPDTGLISSVVQGPVGTGLPPISQIGFVDEYFLGLAANSQIFYNSGLNDGATWDQSFIYQVSEFADNVVAMFVSHREVWMFGNKKTIVYQDTGDPFTPFQPIEGAFIEQGAAAQWAIVRLIDSLLWIGGDERGQGIAWGSKGYAAVRISTHAVENAWRSYPTISDAIGYTFEFKGHTFWHIYFPTADASWRYDATIGQWHEVTWFDNGVEHAHRSRCYAFCFGQHLVGDTQSGNVYSMSEQNLNDSVVYAPAAVWLYDDNSVQNPGEANFLWKVTMDNTGAISAALDVFGPGPSPDVYSVNNGTNYRLWVAIEGNLGFGAVGLEPGSPDTSFPMTAANGYIGTIAADSAGNIVTSTPVDLSSPIRRWRNAPHVINELEWYFHHKLRVHLEAGLGPIPALPGTPEGQPFVVLEDADGQQWLVMINDDGSQNPGTTANMPLSNLIFADLVPPATTYVLGVSTAGALTLTPTIPPQGLSGFIQRLPMMTQPSALQTSLSVQYGALFIDPPRQAVREPQVMLRWSDDGGHSWKNIVTRGAGFGGEFRRRVEWRRLGRTRDRVYQIAVTDPIPWRIVDAYLFATPDFVPTERLTTRMTKMA